MNISFVLASGKICDAHADAGSTVMQVALAHQISGIQAECGGQCSCATCHCYVDQSWVQRLPQKQSKEADLLDFVWEPRDTSRLACQIVLTEGLDGLIVHVPSQQL